MSKYAPRFDSRMKRERLAKARAKAKKRALRLTLDLNAALDMSVDTFPVAPPDRTL